MLPNRRRWTVRGRPIHAVSRWSGLGWARGLWTGRALHSPSRPQTRAIRCRSLCARRRKELLGSLIPERLQQTLHDRMLFLFELLGVFVAQPADDSQCGELRLRRKPVLDRSKVRVEFG